MHIRRAAAASRTPIVPLIAATLVLGGCAQGATTSTSSPSSEKSTGQVTGSLIVPDHVQAGEEFQLAADSGIALRAHWVIATENEGAEAGSRWTLVGERDGRAPYAREDDLNEDILAGEIQSLTLVFDPAMPVGGYTLCLPTSTVAEPEVVQERCAVVSLGVAP